MTPSLFFNMFAQADFPDEGLELVPPKDAAALVQARNAEVATAVKKHEAVHDAAVLDGWKKKTLELKESVWESRVEENPVNNGGGKYWFHRGTYVVHACVIVMSHSDES